MPCRNAFSGLEALLDTVPSRAGSGEGEPSPAGPSPVPGNPPPGPAMSAPAEPPPAAETPAPAEAPAAAAPARSSRPSASPALRPPRRSASSPAVVPRSTPFSVKIPADLLDRARDAAYWVPGVTLTGMIQEGLRAVIEQLQREHNGGKPFLARRGPVRTGRPLGR